LRLAYFTARDPFEGFDANEFSRTHETVDVISRWPCGQAPPGPFTSTIDLFRELMKIDLCLKFRLDYYFLIMRRWDSDGDKRQARLALRDSLLQIMGLAARFVAAQKLVSWVVNGSFDWPWITGGFWVEMKDVNFLPFDVRKVAFTYGLTWER